jgi:hypothetical protein
MMDTDNGLAGGTPRRPGGGSSAFLALTFVVILVIALLAPDLMTAVLLIGLIANFFIISTQMSLLHDRAAACGPAASVEERARAALASMVNPPSGVWSSGGGFSPRSRPDSAREAFTGATTAPPGAGAPAFPNVPRTTPGSAPPEYPGAIDFGGTDYPVVGDEAPALGHADWAEASRVSVPAGNPYDLDRISSPQAAPPCIDDDALALYDGDELTAYQVRSRNEPERVWAGIYRRKALVDRYVGEELDERENSRWWGAGEV